MESGIGQPENQETAKLSIEALSVAVRPLVAELVETINETATKLGEPPEAVGTLCVSALARVFPVADTGVLDGEVKKDRLLTTGEAAKIAPVRRRTIRRWAKEGKLPAIQTLGGHYKVWESGLRKKLGLPDQEDL